MLAIGLVGNFGALNVNAVLGSSIFSGLALTSWGFIVRGPATMPKPVSTRACPLEPALDPRRGISFLAWKFLGLRPRTTMGAVVASVSTTLDPFVRVPITFRCTTKCCCSSFLLPLFAVALDNRPVSCYSLGCSPNLVNVSLHSELQTPPPDRVYCVLSVALRAIVLEWNKRE